ncbi:phasin family protein [Skermanella pratensis]|uniref:phasin family protein n=1 Tax=Skermanella pratensis TaxID=2233999 RepID=UPI001300D7D8|nr:phasin family protein [Skermanella pratensis]
MAADKESAANVADAEESRIIEASKNTLRSVREAGKEAGDKSMDSTVQFVGESSARIGMMFDFSMRVSEEAAKHATFNMDVLMRCGTIVTEGWQAIMHEWISTTRETAQKNMSDLEELMNCRSVDALLSCQSSILRDRMETLHNSNIRISEVSTQVASDTAKRISELTSSLGGNLSLMDEAGQSLRNAGTEMARINQSTD